MKNKLSILFWIFQVFIQDDDEIKATLNMPADVLELLAENRVCFVVAFALFSTAVSPLNNSNAKKPMIKSKKNSCEL